MGVHGRLSFLMRMSEYRHQTGLPRYLLSTSGAIILGQVLGGGVYSIDFKFTQRNQVRTIHTFYPSSSRAGSKPPSSTSKGPHYSQHSRISMIFGAWHLQHQRKTQHVRGLHFFIHRNSPLVRVSLRTHAWPRVRRLDWAPISYQVAKSPRSRVICGN